MNLTDFSECANRATNVALDIAQMAEAEVIFIHVLVTPIDWVKLDIRKEAQYQYVGMMLITIGFLIQWPTVITLGMWPILLFLHFSTIKV